MRGCGRRDGRERVAIYLDLENFVVDDEDGARFRALCGSLRERTRNAVVVAAVGCCAPAIAERFAFELGEMGVRLHVHHGGPDAADNDLVGRLHHELPRSAETVVIASGDHAFAATAASIRAGGRRVEVLARAGSLSHQLYRAADDVLLVAPAHAEPR